MTSSPPHAGESGTDTLGRLRIERDPARTARRRGARRLVIWGLVALAVFAGAFLMAREQLFAPHVRIGKVRRVQATEGAVKTTASGYVVARTRAAISSRLSGRLEKLLVDVGDRVKAGDVLAELGHADLDAAAAEAEADLEVRRRAVATSKAQRDAAAVAVGSVRARVAEAEASVREAQTRKADADRIVAMQERLDKAGAGVRDALESARMQRSMAVEQIAKVQAAVESAKADVARSEAEQAAAEATAKSSEAALAVADAAIARAKALRQDAFIVAPFDGVVVRKEAEVGEMVAPVSMAGTTTKGAVVTLVDFGTLEMEVDVIERDIAKVEDGAPCRIVLDACRDHPYAGKVRQKVPTADRATSTVRVKVVFDGLDAFVLPEMGGRVEFLAPEKAAAALAKDQVLAPSAALAERDGKTGVFVVREERLEWLPVKSAAGGATSGGETEIAEGLAGGEDVVLSPAEFLRSGMLVKTSEP